jgi:hypothetical protein
VLIKELDAAQGDGTGTARVLLDVLEIEAVVTEFFLRDAVGGRVVMLRQLANSSDIPLLGPFGQAFELQVFEHALAQVRHGDTSCRCGLRDGDVQEVSPLDAAWQTLQPWPGLREDHRLRAALSSTKAWS